MKRSIFFFALFLASVSAASAQRTASASMQISATVVESARLDVISTESGASVVSTSLSGVMFAVNQVRASGVTHGSSVRRDTVQRLHVDAAPVVVVSAYYQ